MIPTWTIPKTWIGASATQTSRESFSLSANGITVDAVVDFVPQKKFGVDAVVSSGATIVRPMAAHGQGMALVREFLEFNGLKVEIGP